MSVETAGVCRAGHVGDQGQLAQLQLRVATLAALQPRPYLRPRGDTNQHIMERSPVAFQDGALAVLAMSKDPNAASAIEELFAEFLATDCALPEKPSSNLPQATETGAASEAGVVQ